MNKSDREIKIGELLKALGLVKETQLAETLRLAVQVGLPLGRSLVVAGHLTEEELEVALELQVLMKSGSMNLADAKRVYGFVTEEGIALKDALNRLGRGDAKDFQATNQLLGSLLLDAQLISPTQLEEAQRMSYESGFPLNRALGLLGFVPHAVLARAMELQTMVTDSKINYFDAVKLFSSKGSRRLRGHDANAKRGIQSGRRAKVKLLQMLVVSGVLSESDLMNVVEDALTSNEPLGVLLSKSNVLSRETLDLAIELQLSISDGNLTIQAAADALKYVATASNGRSELPPPSEHLKLGDLLKCSGLVDSEDITQALELSSKYASMIGKMFVVSGAISEATLIAALRCQAVLRKSQLKVEDGIRALQYAERQNVSFDEAVDTLGISLTNSAAADKPVASN
jgi:hypothetical protein